MFSIDNEFIEKHMIKFDKKKRVSLNNLFYEQYRVLGIRKINKHTLNQIIGLKITQNQFSKIVKLHIIHSMLKQQKALLHEIKKNK